MKTEILSGIHSVLEAVNAGRRDFFEIYIAKKSSPKRFGKLPLFGEKQNVPVRRVDSGRLKSLAGTDKHQGVCARVGPYPLVSIADILNKRKFNHPNHFILLLDCIADPHNLGALVRTALCAGTDGIVISKDRSSPPTPSVSRTSAGALEHVFLARVTNMVSAIKTLKKEGLWIMGMDRFAGTSIFGIDLTCSAAIVIGGEEKGMRRLVKKHCDLLMSIPQKGEINSLNASVAGGVVMYEAFRQRVLSQAKLEP